LETTLLFRWRWFRPAERRDYLDQLPKSGKFIIANTLTQPIGYKAIEKLARAVLTKLAGIMPGWLYMVGDTQQPWY
jgi:hypothetical protein